MKLEELIEEGKSFKFENSKMYNNEGRVINVIQNNFYLPEKDKYDAWIIKTTRYLKINHINDYSTQIFIDISNESCSANNLVKLIAVLESLKDFPNTCPTILHESVPQTVVNVSQNQQQTISVDIFEVIRNGLNDNQLKEIRQIIEKEKNPQIAKPKIIEKLKTFGDTVITNVIADIITNPAIWMNF